MKLRDFRELVQAAGFRVFCGSYCIDISNGRTPCASVSLCKYADSWVNTQSIDDKAIRAQLISFVSEFANTPLNDRLDSGVKQRTQGIYPWYVERFGSCSVH